MRLVARKVSLRRFPSAIVDSLIIFQ